MRKAGSVKTAVRLLLVLASLCIAFLVMLYAASFTGAPLRSGGVEGTPVTVVVTFTIFPLSFVVVLASANYLMNRYFRKRRSK
jgi:uncharacterized membrane protein